MGINKSNIRHVIQNGVPENILSWAQELGRCGYGGKIAISYHMVTTKVKGLITGVVLSSSVIIITHTVGVKVYDQKQWSLCSSRCVLSFTKRKETNRRNVTSFHVCSQKPVLNNCTILQIAPSSVRPVMMFTLCRKTFSFLRYSLIRD